MALKPRYRSGATLEQLQDKYVFEYLQALNCPRSLTVYLLYKSGEHDQLANLELNSADYIDLVHFRDSLAATKFLSKATFLSTSCDKKEVALKKFFEAESACRETNRRFASRSFLPGTHSILMRMSTLINKILGKFDAEEFADSADWGPGASVSIPRRRSSKPYKYLVERDMTPEAYDLLYEPFKVGYPLWFKEDFLPRLVTYNKIVTVPKNAKTDRTIAIEPGINLYFQKAIGRMIRRRLKHSGIDLNSQEINQERSRVGSKHNHLATVDFSSASDTISLFLVRDLLPADWLAVMECLRSKLGRLNGENVSYEKFSSMGNGFTFELESLIFYTLGIAVCESLGIDYKGLSVFGDDVVIPSDAYDAYSFYSSQLGFSVNKSKSYSTGYYRESCGAHYWNGIDVKPIFQKEPLVNERAILKTANNVRRLSHRRSYSGCDRAFRRCWLVLSSAIDSPCISEGFGDVGLIVNFDEADCSARPPVKAKHGIEGFYARCYVDSPIRYFTDSYGLLLDRVKAIGSDLAIGNYPNANGRTKTFLRRILIPRWYDLGPWN